MQSWQPDRYRRDAGFVSELGEPLLGLLAPRPGERVLDSGCGDGALTAKIAARGCAVVGIDASPAMIAAAQRRGLDARLMAAGQMPFRGEFDAAFSNAALHWMGMPEPLPSTSPAAAAPLTIAPVLIRIFDALQPGGRFVGEMGGAGNVHALNEALYATVRRFDPAAPHPVSLKYYPAPRAFHEALQQAGFEVQLIQYFPRPTPLPKGVINWYEIFATEWLERIPAPARPAALAELENRLRPLLYDSGKGWWADYVRLRFLALRPAA